MSPEINGNPPSITKRKKNRDKKAALPSNNPPANDNFDLNASSNCSTNYFSSNSHTCRNMSIPDVSTYYSFMNCSNTSEPLSLPVYPLNYPSYTCPPPNFNFMANISTPKHIGGNLPPPHHYSHVNGDSVEYLSLPVVNMDQNSEADKRRFSDPGLPNESDSSSNSLDDRIIHKLVQQINSLKENNRRLSREVMELKVEMNMLKQQYGSRHWDRDYEPGMLADVIREVRDAARVREDALLARVKHLIEEKQLNMNHLHIIAEKNKNNDRIVKLEEQMKTLTLGNQRSDDVITTTGADSSARQVLELEREALELRRELQDTRAKKEEADQKVAQLDKTLSNFLRHNISTSDVSEDGKTASIECLSVITSASSVSQAAPAPRVTLSGPVTDL